MKIEDRKVLVCNCEQTMELDSGGIAKALGAEEKPHVYNNLCRIEIEAFDNELKSGEPLLVGCTQEAPLFREMADEADSNTDLTFVNIRERAGWCTGKAKPTAKIAALLAEAIHIPKPTGSMLLRSDGVCLVYGGGQEALDVAAQLSTRLNVTLLFSDADDVTPPTNVTVPMYRGKISLASGNLGAFEIVVDNYAPVMASSKSSLQFLMAKDGAASKCDLIFDMSDNSPLFTGHDRRDGYFRVDPKHPAGIAKAMFEISDMIGEFEKPLYVDFDPDICAHSRNNQVGCHNCLDVCPTGAIGPAGDYIAVDAAVCGGCGMCSSSCPTGAVSYALPRREDLINRMQILLSTYAGAGGKAPVLLMHDQEHGAEIISAIARYGDGLPINVLPIAVQSPSQLGHEIFASALAAGAEHVLVLASPEKPEENATLEAQIGLANTVVSGLDLDEAARIHAVIEQDPEIVEAALRGLPAGRLGGAGRRLAKSDEPGMFAPVGGKRAIARAAFIKLHERAIDAPDTIALPELSPYGQIKIASEGCTLCLACVSCCPADALHDNPDKPQVRFLEGACVQCGLCATTCPEKVITLEPRFNFATEALSPRILHEEEPAECIRCGKEFGSKGTIERIAEMLTDKHSMFMGDDRAQLIRMCDDCRIITQNESTNNPFVAGDRPRVRMTEDYFAADEDIREHGDKALKSHDFLKDED